jgi:hypothetical protein
VDDVKAEIFVVDFSWEKAQHGGPLPPVLGLRVVATNESEASALHALVSQGTEASVEWVWIDGAVRIHIKGHEPKETK